MMKIRQNLHIRKMFENFRMKGTNQVSAPAESGLYLTRSNLSKAKDQKEENGRCVLK